MNIVGPTHVQPRVGRTLRTRPQQPRFRKGIALCLSGGGYRAMLFHLGTLIRLNELKMLPEIKRISSVSGGSIVAGFVGVQWDKLHFDSEGKATNLYSVIVDPIKRFAHKSIIQKNFWLGKDLLLQALDGRHIIFGQDNKRHTNRSAVRMVKILEEELFGGSTLQNLTDKGPTVYLNATNMQTGNMWLFSKAYMGDSKIGYINEPDVKLSEAVAASAAFPIVLSPFILDVTGKPWVGDHKQEPREIDPTELEQEEIPEYADYENMDEQETTPLSAERIDRVFLSDGGVYDNLGLDVCWKKFKKIIVSDGGGSLEQQYAPADDVAFQGIRVVHVIDAQVRAFRKRQIIDSIDIFKQDRPPRAGAYFSIRGEVDPRAYGEWNSRNLPLKCDPQHISELAHIETGLEELDESSTNRLINWGYAKCDATVRMVDHYLQGKQMPVLLPHGVADRAEFPMRGYSV